MVKRLRKKKGCQMAKTNENKKAVLPNGQKGLKSKNSDAKWPKRRREQKM